MPNINDRIGSQNVIRVLSNASAPPTRLVNLSDVDSARKTEDGMILVWDLSTEKFFLTDAIDASKLTVTGIVTFSNSTDSSSPTTGALVISGGLGVGKQVSLGNGFSVAGLSTFSSNVDINALLDVQDGINCRSHLSVQGVSVLAGVVTTGSDLHVGGDLHVADDLTFDEFTARAGTVTELFTVSGLSNLQSIVVGGASTFSENVEFKKNVSIAGTLTYEDVTNIDSIGLVTARSGIEIGHPSVASTMTSGGDLILGRDLFVSGVSTFTGAIDSNGSLDVDGHTELDDVNIAGVTTFNNADVIFQGAAAGQNITFDASENDLEFTDAARIKFGNNDDLEIWHDAPNSNIKNSTGDFHIRSDSLALKTADNSERYLKATKNQDVKLYYNGNEKFATTGAGVTVLGTAETQQLNVTGVSTFVGIATFSNDVFVSGTLEAGLIDGGEY